MEFTQKLYNNIFKEHIEERMEVEEVMNTLPESDQTTTQIKRNPPPNPTPRKINASKVSKSFNEESFYELNNKKIIFIKKKLINSLLNINEIEPLMEEEINYDNINNMISYLKVFEEKILINKRKEINFYVTMGRIIKQIKLIFPLNWSTVLKENKINHTHSYFNFLIQLYDLFSSNEKLYKSSLSLSFFKKNFSIIQAIVKNGI